MEMLILAMVAAFVVKNAAVDTTAMITGRTPPSHAYRMAKLRAEGRRVDPDPDRRAGFSRVLRHWYLDACEDVDHWRAHRRQTRPQRKAAAKARRERRARLIREWMNRPRSEGDGSAGGEDPIVDAEVVDETPEPEQASPQAKARPGAAASRTACTQRRRTTTTTTQEEEVEVSDETGLVVYEPRQQEAERPPLAHRRMVLATMIAEAGHHPDWEAIGQMADEEVDQALEAVMQRRRAQSTA